MSATEIILPKHFDINKIKLSEPKQLSTGGKSIYINYGNGGRLLMQTPVMSAPFGVSKWPGENGGADKYNMDLSFDGVDDNASMRTFLDVTNAIDTQMIKLGMDNSQLWFKKRFPTIHVLEELFTRTIRHSKDAKTGELTNRYPPRIKIALPVKENRFSFDVYKEGQQKVDFMEMLDRTKGARVQAIVHLSSIWIVGTKFGLTWRVHQLKIKERPQLDGYAFLTTGEEDDLEDEITEPAPSTTKMGGGGSATDRSGARGADDSALIDTDPEDEDA